MIEVFHKVYLALCACEILGSPAALRCKHAVALRIRGYPVLSERLLAVDQAAAPVLLVHGLPAEFEDTAPEAGAVGCTVVNRFRTVDRLETFF